MTISPQKRTRGHAPVRLQVWELEALVAVRRHWYHGPSLRLLEDEAECESDGDGEDE